MTGVIRHSMMVQAFESVFHHSRYAVSSSGVEAAVGTAEAGSIGKAENGLALPSV